MSDHFFLSRHRLTYTPRGGTPIVLLEPGELCAGEPELRASLVTQKDEIIDAAWVSHHSRGNAELNLRADVYRRAATPAHAQAAALELWRHLITHPEGELLYETAFSGYCSDPLISWHFHATLNSADPQELTADTTPFEDACGYQMQYEFTLTDPKEEG